MSTKASKPVPRFFRTEADFRRWLERHHTTADVLWVGYYKKGTGRPSIDWPQSRDQALCFGWIDGLRKSYDADSYIIRFTPRRPGSIWSAINIDRVAYLKKQGLMTPAGLKVFAERDPKKSQRYSFEQMTIGFSAAQTRMFKANKKAWAFFQQAPPSYRKMATWWVIQAKKDETKQRRFETLLEDSAEGRRIGPLRGSLKQ